MRIIVIGAGLFGITTAYNLAEAGHEVLVLDRQEGSARGTSRANGGIVHAGNAAPWNGPGMPGQLLRGLIRGDPPVRVRATALPGAMRWGMRFLAHSRREAFEASLSANARLAVYSIGQLRGLRERTGIEYDADSRGALAVFRDQRSLAEARREGEVLTDAGVRFEPQSAAEVTAREPALENARTDIAGGLYYPDDESGDAGLFVERLADIARQSGARFYFTSHVSRIDCRDGRVRAVDTNRGRFRGDAYVLAAGPQSTALARGAGLRLPIYPVKGYSLTIPVGDTEDLPTTPIIDGARRIVLARLGNRLRVAGFAELAGANDQIDHKRIRALLDSAAELFPSLEGTDLRRSAPWAGLRPMTHDGRPVLGGSPVERLYLAAGPGHLGWTFAAGAGRLVADIVTGAEPEIDPGGLDYARFER